MSQAACRVVTVDMGEIAVSGPCDVSTADALELQLLDQLRRSPGVVLVDLDAVTHLAAAGVRVLGRCAEDAARRGQEVTWRASPHTPAHLVLGVTGHLLDSPAPGTCPAPVRHSFEATDVDQAEALLREQYGAMRLTPGDGPFLMRFDRRRAGGVQLDRATMSMGLVAESEPLGALIVGRVVGGRLGYRRDGHETWYDCGDVFLVAQPDHEFESIVQRVETEHTVLHGRLLNEVAQAGRTSEGLVRLLGYQPTSPAAAALWERTFAFVESCLDAAPPVGHWPLVLGQLERLLATTAIAVFPSNALVEPTLEDRHDAHPRALQRAVAFIDANAYRDITPVDIAGAAGVSLRSVQLAFRRHLDVTPTAYLRQVRLHGARDALTAADAADETVAAIAARWGFFNPGRFARQYREEIGELPRQTLER